MIMPVILCGGSGTRLWPLSRRSLPKQFVPLIGGRSLLELALERVKPLVSGNPKAKIVCVGAEEHRFFIKEAVEAVGAPATIILEPVARNTAAAMTLAALHAAPEQQLLFAPADHRIPDVARSYRWCSGAARQLSPVRSCTFGVTPSFPSTAYGYVERGERAADDGYTVARFIEKPDSRKAQELVLSGNVLWNAGIFLCTAATMLNAMEEHAPDILAACRAAMSNLGRDGDFLRPVAEAFGDAARKASTTP